MTLFLWHTWQEGRWMTLFLCGTQGCVMNEGLEAGLHEVMRNKELAKQTAAALGAGAIKKRKGWRHP